MRRMTSATLKSVADLFGVGAVVGAYVPSGIPGSSPISGAAVTTATVQSDGSLTFSGLADSTNYVAYLDATHFRRFNTTVTTAGEVFAGATLVAGATQTADYAAGATDMGKLIVVNAASAAKVSIPTDLASPGALGRILSVLSKGAADAYLAPTIDNLETDPSHELGLAYSNRGAGTVSRVQGASPVQFGAWAGNIAYAGAGTGGFFKTMPAELRTPGNPNGRLKPGDKVSWSLRFDNSIGATGVLVTVRWFNGTTQLREDALTVSADPQTGKSIAILDGVTIPAGADSWTGTFNATVAGAGNIPFDGSMICKGPLATRTYTDPSIAGSEMQWLGAAHASRSQAPIVRGAITSVPQNGVVQAVETAPNDWTIKDQPQAEVAQRTDQTVLSKRDGQAGIVAPFPSTSTGVPAVSGQSQFTRYYCDEDINIATVPLRVTNAAGANDAIEVAVWDSTLATKLATTGSTTAAAINVTGDKSVTLTTSVTLVAGNVYYFEVLGVYSSTVPSFGGIANYDMARAFGSSPPQATFLTKTGRTIPSAAPVATPSAALAGIMFAGKT